MELFTVTIINHLNTDDTVPIHMKLFQMTVNNNEDDSLLGHSAMQSYRITLIFQRCLQPPSSHTQCPDDGGSMHF